MCEELGAVPYDIYDENLVDFRFDPETGRRVWPPHIEARSRFPQAMEQAAEYAEQFKSVGLLEPDIREHIELGKCNFVSQSRTWCSES